MVTVDGIYRVDQATVGQDRIHGTSLIAIDAALTGAWLCSGERRTDLGTARATAIAEVTRHKDIYMLTKSTVIAAARHVGARKTDLAVGSITASVRASGRLYPKPQIKVTGSVGGDSLRYGDLSAQTVDLSLNAANVTKLASGHLDLGTVRNGDTVLGSASLDAHGALEHTDAGNIVTIDVDSHTITTASQGTWTGSGGHVVIDPAKITVDESAHRQRRQQGRRGCRVYQGDEGPHCEGRRSASLARDDHAEGEGHGRRAPRRRSSGWPVVGQRALHRAKLTIPRRR